MHARWLIDGAALLTYYASAIVQRGTPLPSEVMNRYWLVSRQRFDAWNKSLREYRECLEVSTVSNRNLIWRQMRPTIEEVFLSDIAVRCLSAVTQRLEAESIDRDSHSIVNSIFAGQEDLRNRCLHIMSGGIGQPTDLSFQLNRVRQSMEIWNDTLVAMIDGRSKIERYVFNKVSLIDHAYCEPVQATQRQELRWQFMISGCQQWIGQHCTSVSANPEFNEGIHRAIFSLLQPEWMNALQYDSSDIVQSEKLIGTLQGLIDEAMTVGASSLNA